MFYNKNKNKTKQTNKKKQAHAPAASLLGRPLTRVRAADQMRSGYESGSPHTLPTAFSLEFKGWSCQDGAGMRLPGAQLQPLLWSSKLLVPLKGWWALCTSAFQSSLTNPDERFNQADLWWTRYRTRNPVTLLTKWICGACFMFLSILRSPHSYWE